MASKIASADRKPAELQKHGEIEAARLTKPIINNVNNENENELSRGCKISKFSLTIQ